MSNRASSTRVFAAAAEAIRLIEDGCPVAEAVYEATALGGYTFDAPNDRRYVVSGYELNADEMRVYSIALHHR